MTIRALLLVACLGCGTLLGALGCGASNSVEMPKKPVPLPKDGPVSAGTGMPSQPPAEKAK